MKTKVNEVPLVGPKGRKELLRRINELEAQVAQQDFLRIGPFDITAVAEDEAAKEQIKNAISRGVIFDTIILYKPEEKSAPEEMRVIAHDPHTQKIAVYSAYEGEIFRLFYGDE